METNKKETFKQDLSIDTKYAILQLIYILLLSADCSENDNCIISSILEKLDINNNFGGLVINDTIPWTNDLLRVFNQNFEDSCEIVSILNESTKQEVKNMLWDIAKNDNFMDRIPVAMNICKKANLGDFLIHTTGI